MKKIRMHLALFAVVLTAGVTEGGQEANDEQKRAPRVKSVVPAIGAVNVDPSLKEIRVVFDMPMSRNGYSVVGKGPHFPTPAGQPRWDDAYTFVMPINLKVNWEYRFGVNSVKYRNFRSVWFVPSEPTTCHFKTGGMGDIRHNPDEQRRLNIASFDALIDALRAKYSYFELRDVEWEKLFAEHRRDIVNEPTTDGWLRRTAKMLAAARDVHLTLELDGQQVPTFIRRVDPNFQWSSARKLIPNLRRLNDVVSAGTTDDDIAYILIATWAGRSHEDLKHVQERLEASFNAPGLIIDVRPNSGGSEMLARSVAAWFIDKPSVYAKHVYRRGAGPDDFTPVRERIVEPNAPPRRYAGPVAVLMGRKNLSSCEAFLLMMKQAERAILIGETSYGSSGTPAPTFLPNGVKALIPSWKSLTPEGACIETKGITPDIHVPSKGVNFAEEDPVLEAALDYLRKIRRNESRQG